MTALSRNSKGTYLIDGQKFPSVTTILGVIAKPALTYWSAKCVAEAAVLLPNEWIPIAKRDQQAAIDHLKSSPWRDRDRGANLGSALHKAIECDTLGLPMPEMDEPCTEMLAQARPYLDLFDWELAEATVVSKSVGYAGTLDGIVRLKVPMGRFPAGAFVIIDLKTNKPGKQGHGCYTEHVWQLAAYRWAELVCLPDGSQYPIPEVDGAAILWVRPNECRFLEVDAGQAAYRAFLAAFALYRFTNDDQTAWIGNQLTPEVVTA